MGAWGLSPWEDDSAADWFGVLFDELPIAAKVEEALNLDPEDEGAEIRAAASMLIMLGRSFIWPIDDLDRHLRLAIEQMTKVAAANEDEPDFASAINEEIAILKSRLADHADGATPTQPSSWSEFWS